MSTLNKRELWVQLNNYHFNHLASPNLWNQLFEKFGGKMLQPKHLLIKFAGNIPGKNHLH